MGGSFVPEHGVTQGGIILPILFNILVEAGVWIWYADVMEVMMSTNIGLGGDIIREQTILLCTDDSVFGKSRLVKGRNDTSSL